MVTSSGRDILTAPRLELTRLLGWTIVAKGVRVPLPLSSSEFRVQCLDSRQTPQTRYMLEILSLTNAKSLESTSITGPNWDMTLTSMHY
jgi:hypothetical protein